MSLRSLASNVWQAILGREQRSVEIPFEQSYAAMGMPPLFKPRESLESYGDNPWLAGAVDKIAREVANTKFRLQRDNEAGETEVIKSHQAIETLHRPQATAGGKTMLTGYQLKLLTGQHLALVGEAFWLLDDRMSQRFGNSPRRIDLLRPDMINSIISNGEISEYIYNIGTKQIRFDPADVVHYKMPDPLKPQRGVRPRLDEPSPNGAEVRKTRFSSKRRPVGMSDRSQVP